MPCSVIPALSLCLPKTGRHTKKKKREAETKRHRQPIDTQTQRQTEKQTRTRIGRQTNTNTHTHTDRLTDRPTIDRPAGGETASVDISVGLSPSFAISLNLNFNLCLSECLRLPPASLSLISSVRIFYLKKKTPFVDSFICHNVRFHTCRRAASFGGRRPPPLLPPLESVASTISRACKLTDRRLLC